MCVCLCVGVGWDGGGDGFFLMYSCQGIPSLIVQCYFTDAGEIVQSLITKPHQQSTRKPESRAQLCIGNEWIRAMSQYTGVFFMYGDVHYKDETVVRPSHLYNGNLYSSKMTSLYWDDPQISGCLEVSIARNTVWSIGVQRNKLSYNFNQDTIILEKWSAKWRWFCCGFKLTITQVPTYLRTWISNVDWDFRGFRLHVSLHSSIDQFLKCATGDFRFHSRINFGSGRQ